MRCMCDQLIEELQQLQDEECNDDGGDDDDQESELVNWAHRKIPLYPQK